MWIRIFDQKEKAAIAHFGYRAFFIDLDKLPDDKALWGESWIDSMARVCAVRRDA